MIVVINIDISVKNTNGYSEFLTDYFCRQCNINDPGSGIKNINGRTFYSSLT